MQQYLQADRYPKEHSGKLPARVENQVRWFVWNWSRMMSAPDNPQEVSGNPTAVISLTSLTNLDKGLRASGVQQRAERILEEICQSVRAF
jgi:hypothetical protein